MPELWANEREQYNVGPIYSIHQLAYLDVLGKANVYYQTWMFLPEWVYIVRLVENNMNNELGCTVLILSFFMYMQDCDVRCCLNSSGGYVWKKQHLSRLLCCAIATL